MLRRVVVVAIALMCIPIGAARYYSPGLLLTGLAVAGARSAGLTERDGHLTIMVCENSEQRDGRRGHRR